MSDPLTKVCEDLLQLRDEVAQSDFRPAADDICARLTAIAGSLEACYSQRPSGDGDEVQTGGVETHAERPERTAAGETDAEAAGAEVEHKVPAKRKRTSQKR